MTKRVSRLAPSPTGALHLGNARTFLVNWAIARREGWTLLLRLEDLDGPRVKPESVAETIDVLAWLGLDHDGPVTTQRDDLDPYRAAMRELSRLGLVYPCALTRAEIEHAASAPHEGEHEIRFPSTLRPANASSAFEREDTNYRLRVEDERVAIEDVVLGRSEHDPSREVGDFVLWTRRGVPSYQLAVVVDDARSGVTDVVRGADLLASAARQALLYRALERPAPRWWHLPLVVGPDGRRLAKRHGDSRLSSYRATGVTAERIIGLLAAWSGAIDGPEEMTAEEFRDTFDLARLARKAVTFTESDHRWLLAKCG